MNELFFANIQPGTLLFGRFELLKCLSATNAGAVYLCNDLEDRAELVALKVLSTRAANDEKLCERFKNEVAIASKVNHKNVVKSTAFYQDEEFTAFTMEYISGGTLADKISSGYKFTVEEVLDIMLQLASGLEAIHKAKVVHRDIKPENILIHEDGTYKISDFGIATSHANTDGHTDTEIIGTMNYLSPEYVAYGQYDQRSDIYALGVICYELLTQQLPFKGKSLLESLTMRVKYDPIPAAALRRDCPLLLNRIVTKAIQRKPAHRYQNVADFIRDLEAVQIDAVEKTYPQANKSDAYHQIPAGQLIKGAALAS
ncbi:MAG: serine/threonine protein kinase [Candidatus Dadabacteria bacterium]|nr:MAG: serine/threonine protein kinase [Candidatus Dadabacteria bacterium]